MMGKLTRLYGLLEMLADRIFLPLLHSSTLHKTEARFVSGLGWGLKRRIEEYSASKFKANIEKVSERIFSAYELSRLTTRPFICNTTVEARTHPRRTLIT